MSDPAIALATPEPADGGAEPLAVRAARRPDRRIVCAVPRPATAADFEAAGDPGMAAMLRGHAEHLTHAATLPVVRRRPAEATA